MRLHPNFSPRLDLRSRRSPRCDFKIVQRLSGAKPGLQGRGEQSNGASGASKGEGGSGSKTRFCSTGIVWEVMPLEPTVRHVSTAHRR